MRSKDSETRSDTIFHGLLNSNLPASEKSVDRLQQEAQLIVTAGQDTTGKSSSLDLNVDIKLRPVKFFQAHSWRL